MSALGKVVRAGVGRRRVQTVVMVLTTMTAVMASVMGAALVVASRAPFDHAFARQHGAHVGARFDGAKADPARVAATAHVSGVTAAAGPFAVVSEAARGDGRGGLPPTESSPMTIVGRASPDGPVDSLTLTAGHWATGPGEIVLAQDERTMVRYLVGERLTFPGLPGDPVLTVVGTAFSVSQSAEAWVAPAEIAALTRPGTQPSYEMLYRFRQAGSSAAVARDRAAVAAAVPPGALTGAQSYLVLKEAADRKTATFIPFVVAFGVLGLVMAVLIIGIVVSGAVSAGTRRIGVLKSLGFTPAQVARAYVGQALIPSAVGIVLGVVLGDLASVPLLGQTDSAYGTASLSVAWWIDVAVPAGAVALIVAAALAPALRAARLRTVEAIATGRTPRVGRGRYAARLAARLPLARSLSLGLAAPFARPARSAVIGAAVMFGAIGVTFAFGLGSSLADIQRGLNQDQPGQVTVGLYGPPTGGSGAPPAPAAPDSAGSTSTTSGATTSVPVPTRADPMAVTRAVAAQPGTRGYFSTSFTSATFAEVAGPRTVVAYDGDSRGWGEYQMVAGHWFTGPGQIVTGRRFLEAAGIRVGGTVILEGDGRQARVRVVGEALETGDDGMRVMTDAATLTAVGLSVHPDQLHVELGHGTPRRVYLTRLNEALRPLGVQATPQDRDVSGTVVAMDTIITALTLMLMAVAALGVLNTVVLDTRERVHDLGVLKALGMAPRQTVAMVVVSVAWIGAVAGLIGVPLGMAVHRVILPVMGRAAGTRIPAADMSVYHLPQTSLLAAAGLVIASAGAMLPAGWAARIRTAAALRTE